MKILTITCHNVYNCGASLQAYALQHYLEDLGHDVKIIDYQPKYLSFKYHWTWYINPNSKYFNRCLSNWFFHTAYVTRRYIKDLSTYGRYRVFHIFNTKYFKLTKRYGSFLELCQNPPNADVYIVGSDQVWNNNPLENGWDPSFFLGFGENNVKRVSYAASFGSSDVVPQSINRNFLSHFDSISVREEKGRDLLNDCGVESSIVCDPVFLVNAQSWKSMCKSIFRNKYVLLYNLNPSDSILTKKAQEYAKSMNLPLYSIITKSNNAGGDKNIKNVGPIHFLSLIKDAETVFSNSFHATAFSIIFKKNFYVYTSMSKGMVRITDLLKNLNLQVRYNPDDFSTLNTIDYKEVNNSLQYYINRSKSWIIQQLEQTK